MSNPEVTDFTVPNESYDSSSPAESCYSEEQSDMDVSYHDGARPYRRRNRPHHEPEKRLDEAIELGTICDVKKLYEGKRKCKCCVNWVEEPPEGNETPAERARKSKQLYAAWAVVARTRRHGGSHGEWRVSDVTVQSPVIKEFLDQVLKGYPGIFVKTEHLEFRPPFQPIVHRWSEFLTAQDEAPQEVANSVKLLRDVVEPELSKHLKAEEECRIHGFIEYENLWTIFKPGTLVYWNRDGIESIVKLVSMDLQYSLIMDWFQLHCEQVDWNGQHFGYANPTLFIPNYKGHKHVTELPIYPLSMHPDPSGLKQKLMERGRKFEQLRGYHYKFYKGDSRASRGSFAENVHGRVLVDCFAYHHFQHLQRPLLRRFTRTSRKQPKPFPHSREMPLPPHPPHRMAPPMAMGPPGPIYEPPMYHAPRGPMPPPGGWVMLDRTNGPKPQLSIDRGEDVEELTEEQHLLCAPEVRGFDLKNKKWLMLQVTSLEEIAWDEEAFESLVLPNEEKDLLLAFAESKINKEVDFDDFITGKGKGIIMLLSGPPGTGKTLTAESIAETNRVPLYSLSAGEIGIAPDAVEASLRDALEKCAMWNAVFLLDECDVFLEKRELNSLKRNELVSIFLRLVEYYEGMMFLTTNRIQTIDPAFESRIDVAVSYPELTPTLRRQVWVNFVTRLPGDKWTVSEKEFDKLAEAELNGRQIKSAVKTAQMLAGRQKNKLDMVHLRKVLKLRKDNRFA